MTWGGILFLVVVGACVALLVISFLYGIARYVRFHLRRVDCPACGHRIPFVSYPGSAHQAELGGWTCSQCGAEIDEMGVDMTPLIDETRRLKDEKFVAGLRQEEGSPLEKVFRDSD